MKSKPVSWQRVIRNGTRILKSLTPPVLQGLFTREHQDEPVESNESERPSISFDLPPCDPFLIWREFDQTDVTMLPRQLRKHIWAMPENEVLVLATICKLLRPRKIFEFGTFTGASTLSLAANSEAETKIFTLDIPPTERRSHVTGMGSDIPFDFTVGAAFHGTRYEHKISQVYGDTRTLDVSPYRGTIDLVFVDADHTYEFVKNDTAKALEMLAPGGVILWHDYRWDDDAPECAGVTRWVNEFFRDHGDCVEIGGTRFAMHQPGILRRIGQHTGQHTGQRIDHAPDVVEEAA